MWLNDMISVHSCAELLLCLLNRSSHPCRKSEERVVWKTKPSSSRPAGARQVCQCCRGPGDLRGTEQAFIEEETRRSFLSSCKTACVGLSLFLQQ